MRSGAIEAIISVLAVQRDVVPPTINQEVPDPECDLDYIPNESRERKIDVALSNNFGFGGHNACLVIKKFEVAVTETTRWATFDCYGTLIDWDGGIGGRARRPVA